MNPRLTSLSDFRTRATQQNRWPFRLLGAVLLVWGSCSLAQPLQLSATAQPHPSVTPPGTHTKVTSGPTWTELTPQQKKSLAPLATHWHQVSAGQKQKWLEISKNYGALTPTEQAALNSRMTEWAALSPQERAQARLNFGKTKEISKQLTAEEKSAKWKAYQALSLEEKSKLAAKASPKPKGAATAIKPVAPQKLVKIPRPSGTKPVARPASKIAPSSAPMAAPVMAPMAVPLGAPASSATAQPPLR